MGKNLIIREAKHGRVVDFREGIGNKIDDYKWLEDMGEFIVESTDLHYTNKWGKWWETYENRE